MRLAEIKTYLVFFGICIVSLSRPSLGLSQATSSSSQIESLSTLNLQTADKEILLKQIEIQSQMLKEYERRLSEERQLLERQLDRHANQAIHIAEMTQKVIDRSTNLAIQALVAIFIIGAGTYGFLFGKRMREVKGELDQRSRQIVETALSDIDTRINTIVGKKLTDTEAKLIDTEERINRVKEVIDEFSAYKQRRFTWFLPDKSVSVDHELGMLRNEGIKKVQTINIESDALTDLSDCDVVIFSYDESEKANKFLASITEKLQLSDRHIFLIIYTFNNGKPARLESRQMEILKEFRWYQLASFPMTLISVAKNLVR